MKEEIVISRILQIKASFCQFVKREARLKNKRNFYFEKY